MSQGVRGKLGIDVTSTVSSGYEFDTCEIGLTGENIDASGIRGTREHMSERVRQGLLKVGGTITMQPSALDLSASVGPSLLAMCFGGTPDSTSYPLAETLFPCWIAVNKVVKYALYANAYVNKVTFQSSQGTPMKMSLDIVAETETIAATSGFPSLTYNLAPPFMFFDSVLTVLGSSRQVKDWTLTVDNMLDVLFYNSQTATVIEPKDRKITFNCTNPYTAADTDLYMQLVAGETATLVCTDLIGNVLTFTFGSLQIPPISPKIPGRVEIPIQLQGEARAVGYGTEDYLPSLATTLSLG